MKKHLLILAALLLCSCTAAQIQKAKDAGALIVDSAIKFCEASYSANPELNDTGFSLEEACKAKDRYTPYLDMILATQGGVGLKLDDDAVAEE